MNELQALNRTILLCRDYVADDLSDEQIALSLQSLHVLCVADAITLSCHSGQTALVSLVSLLSRMGMQVGLDVPNVSVLKAQIPFGGTRLCTSLLSASEQRMPGATVRIANSRFPAHIIFVLGTASFKNETGSRWRMSATEWSGSISSSPDPHPRVWAGEWPIGSMVSALLAANEAFKCAMRRLKFRREEDRIFFEASQNCGWDFGAIQVPQGDVDLGNVDVISAGAISQATLYTLASLPRVTMQGRIFDDDSSDISNLNRNMLMQIGDVGISKVGAVTASCNSIFQFEPVLRRFTTISNTQQLASRVLVGVDDIPSRWAVQREASNWIGVAGTSHFSISSSAHVCGQPCSACLHPVDDPGGANPIPTGHSYRSGQA